MEGRGLSPLGPFWMYASSLIRPFVPFWSNPSSMSCRSVTGLLYRRFVDFLTVDAPRAVVDELAQVRAQRHLGGNHQFVFQVPINTPRQLSSRTAAAPDLGQH